MTAVARDTRPAVSICGLRKAFGETVVLDGIDLEIAEGTVFALLGPNGAGKTTAVQILSTLLRADAGTASVAGFDVASEPDRVRAAIGVTGQFSAVDNLLTGEENLLLMADLHHLDRATGRRRAGELLERLDLTDAGGRMVATYSGGMRRRLDLAMTLVVAAADHLPRRADHRSRSRAAAARMWQIIREVVADGVTDPAHHPVPRRGRRARRPRRRPRSRARGGRRARPTSSNAGSRALTPACSSATRTGSTPPPGSSARARATTTHSSCGSRRTTRRSRCARCSNGSTTTASASST